MVNYIGFGPWGGSDGESWDYKSEGNITEMVIQHAAVIDSIVFKSKRGDGAIATSKTFGGGGGKTIKISLKPGEIITGIEVMLGNYLGHSVVYSLSFYTNKTRYGPFGSPNGTRTSVLIGDGEVLGFFGRSGLYLNAIGFYAVATPKSTYPTQGTKRVEHNALSVGPWGNMKGGTSWSYLPAGLLSKITITHGGCIDSIIFNCKASDGTVTCSNQFGGTSTAKYGGPGGHTTNEVVIGSGEYITGIDMMVGEYAGHKVINQLTIYTNLKTNGPFGTATGSKISIPIKNGNVVGFFGNSDIYLNGIGIFVTEIPSEEDTNDDDTVVGPVRPGGKGTGCTTGGVCPGEIGTGCLTGGGDGDALAFNKIFLNINISVNLNSAK